MTPLKAVRELWDVRLDTNSPIAAVAALRALPVRDAGARAAIDQLVQALAYSPGSVAEAGAWYQVLVSWPNGFPPAPTLTPLDRYPFNPVTGPAPVVRFDPQTGRPLP